MEPARDATVVKALLDASGLEVSEPEFAKLVEIYPLLRAQADGLYMPELVGESVALSFDPATYYA